jgi:hypothetical protein
MAYTRPKPTDLTGAARTTLINTHFREGSPLPKGTRREVFLELYNLRLCSVGMTLTSHGSYVRAACMDQALEDMEWGWNRDGKGTDHE